MNQPIKQRSKGVLLLGLLCVASMTVTAETHFEVTGKGFIDVTPYEATFQATVTEVAETVKDAQSAVNDVIANLENAVTQYDLKKGSLDSSALSFHPEYELDSSSKKQVFVGYRVSRNLTFTSEGVADVGAIVQSLAVFGATQISPPNFGYSQPEQETADAMRKAVKYALEKLELMASAAGMSFIKWSPLQRSQDPHLPAYRVLPVSSQRITRTHPLPSRWEQFDTRLRCKSLQRLIE